jgi:2-keto-4-pentenoate hydratase/2-oxohepta-3-ene-1,7-dioic acid hydratase in catechol pathway
LSTINTCNPDINHIRHILHSFEKPDTLAYMKIVRFEIGGKERYGILENGVIQSITEPLVGTVRETEETFAIEKVRLLAPCVPSKIIAVGVNYKSHASELNHQLPERPLIFLKPPTAVIGPEDRILYPDTSHQVDYEGELGVVIGKLARHISRERARDCILGYTCFNDVTARDLQRIDGQWTRSKSFDTFAPVGPWIETELDDTNLTIETIVNGQVVQRGNTTDMVFSVPELISFISDVMTLIPGDIIATGTPGGIGLIRPGDIVEISIKPIGTLRNYLVKEG